MWVAYFLPRWIATHDEISGRSVEKFATAMKAVGTSSGLTTPDISEIKRRGESQIAQRRILFTSILGFGVIVSLLTIIGLISPIILAIPVTALMIYVVHTRNQISAFKEQLAKAQALNEAPRTKNRYDELITRSKRVTSYNFEFTEEQWTPLSERYDHSASEVSGIVLLPKGAAARNTWQPTEVPKPTYVTAPKAAPQRKIIDLTIPGAWTEAQRREIDHELNRRDEVFDQQQADEFERLMRPDRAANE